MVRGNLQMCEGLEDGIQGATRFVGHRQGERIKIGSEKESDEKIMVLPFGYVDFFLKGIIHLLVYYNLL